MGRLTEANRRTDAVRPHAKALRRKLATAEHNEVDKLAEVHGVESAGLHTMPWTGGCCFSGVAWDSVAP
jgi:hypothetical protein